MFVLRLVLALICFAIALVLSVLPGPAIPFWILGLLLLGFSVGQVLLSVQALQTRAHRRFPALRSLPTLRTAHLKAILRHRWVRTLDGWSSHRVQRRHARARRRAARAREGERRS